MKKFSLLAVAVSTLALNARTALATVDVFMNYWVVREHGHTSDLCYFKAGMWAEIGLPQMAVTTALLSPTHVLRVPASSAGPRQININTLATDKVTVEYVSDSYENHIAHFAMKMDVSELAMNNGLGLQGRAATIRYVKSYLIALNKSIAEFQKDKYTLRMEIVGLPSQDGLSGARVHARTQFPYTSSSPLLSTYESEIISNEGSCDAGL